MWNIVNNISKPDRETKWKIIDGAKIIEGEKEVANCFNLYFYDKIEGLKDNIDKKYLC